MRPTLRCLKTNPMDKVPKSLYVAEVQKIEKLMHKYGETEGLEDWSKYTKVKLSDYSKRLYMIVQNIPLARKI